MPTKRKRPSRLYVLMDMVLLALAMPVLLGFMLFTMVVSLILREPPYGPQWDWEDW